MTREEIKKIMMIISATYPNFKPADMSLTIDAWSAVLKGYEYAHIQAALHAYILSDTSGFAPAPGQLIDKICIKSDAEVTELRAWALVSKAISRSTYYAQEEFGKLPEEIQKTIGSYEILQQWAGMEIEVVQSVIQSNFIKNYRIVLGQIRERGKLHPDLQKLIDLARQKLEQSREALADNRSVIAIPEKTKKQLEVASGDIRELPREIQEKINAFLNRESKEINDGKAEDIQQ